MDYFPVSWFLAGGPG